MIQWQIWPGSCISPAYILCNLLKDFKFLLKKNTYIISPCLMYASLDESSAPATTANHKLVSPQAGPAPVCLGSARCLSCSATWTTCVTTRPATTGPTGCPPTSPSPWCRWRSARSSRTSVAASSVTLPPTSSPCTVRACRSLTVPEAGRLSGSDTPSLWWVKAKGVRG